MIGLSQSNPVRMTYLTGSGDDLVFHSLLDAGAGILGLFWKTRLLVRVDPSNFYQCYTNRTTNSINNRSGFSSSTNGQLKD